MSRLEIVIKFRNALYINILGRLTWFRVELLQLPHIFNILSQPIIDVYLFLQIQPPVGHSKYGECSQSALLVLLYEHQKLTIIRNLYWLPVKFHGLPYVDSFLNQAAPVDYVISSFTEIQFQKFK